MDELQIPSAIDTRSPDEPWNLARGPFVMDHNGFLSIGGVLQDRTHWWTVFDGSRTLEIDDTYIVSYADDEISFDSSTYRSHIMIRPLRESDLSWIDPSGRYTSFDSMVVDQARILAANIGA